MVELDVTFDCAHYLFFSTHRATVKSFTPRIFSRCPLHHLETSLVELFEISDRGLRMRCQSHLTAQCAFGVVRWPSGQMAIAVKTLSHGKTIVLRLFFLYCFRKKTSKLVSLSIFRHKKHYFWNTQNWSK